MQRQLYYSEHMGAKSCPPILYNETYKTCGKKKTYRTTKRLNKPVQHVAATPPPKHRLSGKIPFTSILDQNKILKPGTKMRRQLIRFGTHESKLLPSRII